MKKQVILAAFLIALSSPVFSQDYDAGQGNEEYKTIFGHNTPGGFYGAFTMGYSEIDSKQAVIFGGRFEWIVNHSIGFGFGGAGFINEYHYDQAVNQEVSLTGGYGGFYIEPILMPKFPVHLSFPVLLGAGGISYITKETDYHNMIEDSEAFLIAEPAAELELNITRNFRLAAGASYRLTTPFEVGNNGTSQVNSKAIEGWSFLLSFKFGRF